MRYIITMVALAGSLAGQSFDIGLGRTFSGIVKGADGAALPNAMLALKYSVKESTVRKSDWRAVSDAQGSFQFSGLPDGTFELYAQAPGGIWLNPCEWDKPIGVSIAYTQKLLQQDVTLAKGASVLVDVEDPNELLTRYATTPGAHLLVGATTKNLIFKPAQLQAAGSKLHTYESVVPPNMTVTIAISSATFALSNMSGTALKETTIIPVVASSVQEPVRISLTVTGVKGK